LNGVPKEKKRGEQGWRKKKCKDTLAGRLTSLGGNTTKEGTLGNEEKHKRQKDVEAGHPWGGVKFFKGEGGKQDQKERETAGVGGRYFVTDSVATNQGRG